MPCDCLDNARQSYIPGTVFTLVLDWVKPLMLAAFFLYSVCLSLHRVAMATCNLVFIQVLLYED